MLGALRSEIAEQREFVTFHQSYAYEEFVEGLRPVTAGDESGRLAFQVVPGVFRRICQRAGDAVDRQARRGESALPALFW